MSVYLCVRVADADAAGGPLGAAAERGRFCSECGAEVYTDPTSRALAEQLAPPMRLVCSRCADPGDGG